MIAVCVSSGCLVIIVTGIAILCYRYDDSYILLQLQYLVSQKDIPFSGDKGAKHKMSGLPRFHSYIQ